MLGIGMRLRPRHTGRAARAELAQLAERLTFTWPGLRPPTEYEWSDKPVLVLQGSEPWLLGPAERDPLRGRFGTSVLPRAARTKLQEVEGLGVPFQRIAFAHELSPIGPVEPLLPALQFGPYTCSEESARALAGRVPPHPRAQSLVAMLGWAARGPRPLNDSTPTASPPKLGRIIFGVVAPTPSLRDGQLCLWFPLAAWRW